VVFGQTSSPLAVFLRFNGRSADFFEFDKGMRLDWLRAADLGHSPPAEHSPPPFSGKLLGGDALQVLTCEIVCNLALDDLGGTIRLKFKTPTHRDDA
jgi:hypothetical protein